MVSANGMAQSLPATEEAEASADALLPVETTSAEQTDPGTPVADAPTTDTDAGEAVAVVEAPPVKPVAVAATEHAPAAATPAPAAAKPASDGFLAKANDAANATLTLLLPRLAANDALPLLDRSAMLANDLNRLLADHSLDKIKQIGTLDEAGVDGKVQTLLKRALTLLGTPYRWGGTSPDTGFDCSGLVGYVFRTALGIELPRVSRDMAAKQDAQLIRDIGELEQGDLVFFSRRGKRVDHVGIYLGEGRFVHAPRTGKDVMVSQLDSGYWSKHFMQARRVAL